MIPSLDAWLREYDTLRAALERHARRMPDVYGANAHRPLTEPERVFSDLLYYWNAALLNNDDVFGYMRFITAHRADFEAIGAHGTLDAIAKLAPFFEAQERLIDNNEKGAYWWRTKDERAPFESVAEGVHEFARLLLAYADKNLPVGDAP